MKLIVTSSPSGPAEQAVEIVERKGRGHPDTLCDDLAEAFSTALCRFYVDHVGAVLHHNVDKVLLRGGAARPAFGGGEVLEPIEVFMCGRATTHFDGIDVPLAELATESARACLRSRLPSLDVERDVTIHTLVRPGSAALAGLFARSRRPLANDTSLGVGFAPLTPLERCVLETERLLTADAMAASCPSVGQDVKVLGLRADGRLALTVGCAFVDRHLPDMATYRQAKAHVAELAAARAREVTGESVRVTVNAGDGEGMDPGDAFLTVTGTSAEAGDDGEAGRGNRANGLITPYRPMTMESVAGKNPVTHVGKLYNLVAPAIAANVVEHVPEATAAECYLVSRIGHPIDTPPLVHVRLAAPRPNALRNPVEAIVTDHLAGLPDLWRSLLTTMTA